MVTQHKKGLSYPETASDPLVFEKWDGKVHYRKGYRDVLSGSKTVKEIMGSSSLQAEIVSYILQIVLQTICIFDAITFNVGRHLDSEGISI